MEDSTSCWEVHKFGGTSVADADCFRNVASIVERELSSLKHNNGCIALVVSAMGAKKPGVKTTDLLLNCVKFATERNDEALKSTLDQIQTKHLRCIEELCLPTTAHLQAVLRQDINDIIDILKTVSLLKWSASRISELVSGYGVSDCLYFPTPTKGVLL